MNELNRFKRIRTIQTAECVYCRDVHWILAFVTLCHLDRFMNGR